MSDATADAFGVQNDAHEHHDMDPHDQTGGNHVGLNYDDSHPKAPAGNGKFSFMDLPLVAKVGIGFVGLVFLIIVGTVVANIMRRAQVQPPGASETVFQQVVKSEIAGIKLSITAVQESQADLNRKIEQVAINQPREIEVVTQRVVGVERSINALHENVKTLARRAATERPFDFELMAREDAHIVSIGNGVARINVGEGKEITLIKGDKFKGLLVRELIYDRRVVVLSDGSVIL